MAPGTLYIVALPIGNLRDISYRAVDTLRAVALIAAEDTRDFRRIQQEYGIETRVVSYHDFNEQTRSAQLVERLLAGEDVALVSDAGTPLVSDPGYRIVTAAIEAGVRVTSLPGPNAALTALTAAGLPANQFLFLGFPPRAAGQRRAFFERARHETATLVLYEAPHRLVATLADALAVLGQRRACLARNLTKPHERYQRGTLSTLLEELQAEGEVRGEATLVIAGAQPDAAADEARTEAAGDVRRLLAEGLDTREVLRRVMQARGLSRREVYALILAERGAAGE